MFIAGVIHDHEDPCHPWESPDDPQHHAELAGLVLEGAAEYGAEIEMIDLADHPVIPCTACEACSAEWYLCP